MRKKSLVIAAAFALIFFCLACRPSAYDGAKTAAEGIVSWYIEHSGAQRLEQLSFERESWSGGTEINIDTLRVIGYAKKLGIKADYGAAVNGYRTVFAKYYGAFDEIKAAPPAVLAATVFMLDAIGESPLNFMGYDLIEAAYGNTGILYADIYGLPYFLEILNDRAIPSAAPHKAEDIIDLLLAKQLSDGGFGYYDYVDGSAVSDPDTTAMALLGLGLFKDKAQEQCRAALDFLNGFKNTDATYKSAYSDASSSTTAIAVSANILIDGLEDGALAALNIFKNSDGGYRASKFDAPSDIFSSMDCLRALYDIYKA